MDSLSVAVDFHPTRGALRVTGGLLRNDNRLEAISRPSGAVTVGGNTHSPAEVGTLIGRVAFDETRVRHSLLSSARPAWRSATVPVAPGGQRGVDEPAKRARFMSIALRRLAAPGRRSAAC